MENTLFFLKSRSGLYEATATFNRKKLIVHKGSQINTSPSEKFKASKKLMNLRIDSSVVDKNGRLKTDVEFRSFSTAATFVSGHVANGMVCWKTKDGITAKEFIENSN